MSDDSGRISISTERIKQARDIQNARNNSMNGSSNSSQVSQDDLRIASPQISRYEANGLSTKKGTYIKENSDIGDGTSL